MTDNIKIDKNAQRVVEASGGHSSLTGNQIMKTCIHNFLWSGMVKLGRVIKIEATTARNG